MYLKPRKHYSDFYDELTVKFCRDREKYHSDSRNRRMIEEMMKSNEHVPSEILYEVGLYFDLLHTTTERYENKEKEIDQWMEDDKKKDLLLEEKTPPIENVSCSQCHTPMEMTFKDIHPVNEYRVFFVFDCPKGCKTRRTFFDNGEEYKKEVKICPQCNLKLVTTVQKKEGKVSSIIDSCPKCQYKEVFELGEGKEKEKAEADFLKDKKRFCISEQQYIKNKKEIDTFKSFKKLK